MLILWGAGYGVLYFVSNTRPDAKWNCILLISVGAGLALYKWYRTKKEKASETP